MNEDHTYPDHRRHRQKTDAPSKLNRALRVPAVALNVTPKRRLTPLYARAAHDTAVKEVQAVLPQAPAIQIDDVGVKFAESAKLRPPIVMMPPPDSAILIGSLELTTGAAQPTARRTWMRAKDGTFEYRRT